MTDHATPASAPGHRAGARILFGIAGLLWTIWLGGIVYETGAGTGWALVWALCAGALLLLFVPRLGSPESNSLWIAVKWWLASLVAPAALAYLALERMSQRRNADASLERRLSFLERRLTQLQDAVDEVRASATRAAPQGECERTAPSVARRPEPGWARERRDLDSTPLPPPLRAAERRAGFDFGQTVSLVDLIGAKALAIAGGVVTLLGIVFFFVLAVNRGWIDPPIRVACGGVASALVLGTGVWLRRRYGTTYAALAAVGTGIAGGYATLLAAVALYDMVSKPAALAIAAAIASLGVLVSLSWSAELVAGFGLIGAMIVPATLAFQGGLQDIGTAFVAVVFAATVVVAVRKGWWSLLRVAALVSVPQSLIQVANAGAPRAGIVTLAAAFWLLYLGAGLAWQERLAPALAWDPAAFLIGSAMFASSSAAVLFDGRHDGLELGVALLTVGAGYGIAAAAAYSRTREVATLLWVLGLTAWAVGAAEALSGPALTYAWAAEAALLTWLSGRVRDTRFQLAALAYLGLAIAHALAFEAEPGMLFVPHHHPASSVPVLVAIVCAAIVFARFARPWDFDELDRGVLRFFDSVLGRLHASHSRVIAGVAGTGAILLAYAVSLGVLEVFQDSWPGPVLDAPFEWGHVAVDSTWALAGLVGVLLGLRPRSAFAVNVALSWLAVTVAKVVVFDLAYLDESRYGVSLVVVATCVLVTALAVQLARPGTLAPVGAAAAVVSLALALGGVMTLAHGHWGTVDADGAVSLAAGVVYAVLGAALFVRAGQRDASTLFWGLGLTVMGVAEWMLLGFGGWLVLVWAASAAVLAGLSNSLAERRLQTASLGYVAPALVLTLAHETPPRHFVSATAHPGAGVTSLLLVVAALSILAWSLRANVRRALEAISLAGALAVYAASLVILEAVQRISPAGVQTDLQRGQTAVSAFWGLLGLLSLYLGLTRRRRVLRLGGFVLFAVSLGKIFLYDLPSLSSIERALSFLAVGAVLLFGGFFYQRLSAPPLDE